MGLYIKGVSKKDVIVRYNVALMRIQLDIVLPVEAVGLSTPKIKNNYIEEVEVPHGNLVDVDKMGVEAGWFIPVYSNGETAPDSLEAVPLKVIEVLPTIIDEER